MLFVLASRCCRRLQGNNISFKRQDDNDWFPTFLTSRRRPFHGSRLRNHRWGGANLLVVGTSVRQNFDGDTCSLSPSKVHYRLQDAQEESEGACTRRTKGCCDDPVQNASHRGGLVLEVSYSGFVPADVHSGPLLSLQDLGGPNQLVRGAQKPFCRIDVESLFGVSDQGQDKAIFKRSRSAPL